LWWGPWDTEGVPAELCIRSGPAAHDGQRAERRLRFAARRPGQKLAVDVTLPAVRTLVRDQVRLMLGPEGVNADGLKIDHISATPGGYDMAFPHGSGRLFGIEAARSCMELLYTSVKEAKPDALLIGQSPNPYFADVQDMVRLGIAPNSLDSV